MKVLFKLKKVSKWRDGVLSDGLFLDVYNNKTYEPKKIYCFIEMDKKDIIFIRGSKQRHFKNQHSDTETVKKLKALKNFVYTDITLEEIEGSEINLINRIRTKSRRADVVRARRYLHSCLVCAGYSLVSIGKVFKQDHTTVIHSCNKMVEALSSKDKKYRKDQEEMNFLLYNLLNNNSENG